MVERGAGTRSWPLSPYQVNVSFDNSRICGESGWFGPLEPMTPLAPPEVAGRQWDYPAGYNLATTVRNLTSRLPLRHCAGSRTVTIFCGLSSRRARTRPRVKHGRFAARDRILRARQSTQRESQH